jgi:hypothetical protein
MSRIMYQILEIYLYIVSQITNLFPFALFKQYWCCMNTIRVQISEYSMQTILASF